ncbi:rhodanese-like domain-containing protein [Larkinella sp. GY13]|uniref:rhodanese-like domain-containing protein n=1 Tax=Larkinella sp. GY13 TaxID=3453720 RepID=UPI003EEDAA45
MCTGHLPDAKNIDYKRSDFGRLIKDLNKQKPVYVYCLSGGRSKAAAEQLRSLGYGPVYELTGGYLDLQQYSGDFS